jgi:transposase
VGSFSILPIGTYAASANFHQLRDTTEACATGHYWARELGALGHDVRLMAPSYVKPYVKRQKNDAADAEAICEAVGRPTMRFVPVKTAEQQSVMVLHRTRLLLMRQRTRLANAIRGHLAEYGIVAPIGREGLQRLIEMVVDESAERVPPLARACLRLLVTQLQLVNARALATDRQIKASARSTEVGRRLWRFLGLARSWRAPSSLRSRIPERSVAGGIWLPGSAWCRDRTRVAVGSAWVASASKAIATCARCWSLARWR